MKIRISDKSIRDFGDQWLRFRCNEGYYGSTELLKDFTGPLFDTKELKGKKVLEIGSGTGRIVNMVLDLGADHVIAVEPSEAMVVLQQNTKERSKKIKYVKSAGDKLPNCQVDVVLSIGVLHHIPNPEPVVRAAWNSLHPGGKFIFWVYGFENNERYLAFIRYFRKLAPFIPDSLLWAISHVFNIPLTIYLYLCARFPLPLKKYLVNVVGKLSWNKRTLTIFDQLNPIYTKYYPKEEALQLMRYAPFKDINIYHRHQYSWTVVGTKESSE